jgi:hypothetical protein
LVIRGYEVLRMSSREPDSSGGTTLKVIDAFDHPHGDRILRTRVVRGTPPTIKRLKGATLRAVGPEGRQVNVRILGFPMFGGSPSTERIRQSGRVDLVVRPDANSQPIDRTWELEL